MATKQQLLARLPKLPGGVQRRLSSSTIAGIKAERAGGGFALTGDPRQLVDTGSTVQWLRGRVYHQEPDRDVDLLKTNTARRRLITFGPQNESFRATVNRDLSGGDSYPVLESLLGVGVGLASAGAGLLWTGFTTALAVSRTSQQVRVRDGDEIHQVEIVGVNAGRIEYLEWLILIDPFRLAANRSVRQWIVHEERHEVRV